MEAIIIVYDLHYLNANYKGVSEKITQLSENRCWKELNTTWVIKTNLSPAYIRNELTPFFKAPEEKLFIASLDGEAAWQNLSESGRKWLEENL